MTNSESTHCKLCNSTDCYINDGMWKCETCGHIDTEAFVGTHPKISIVGSIADIQSKDKEIFKALCDKVNTARDNGETEVSVRVESYLEVYVLILLHLLDGIESIKLIDDRYNEEHEISGMEGTRLFLEPMELDLSRKILNIRRHKRNENY